VDRQELVRGFASFPARLAVAATTTARLERAGEWGPVEIVRHLIEVERVVWRARFASIVAEDEPAWSWTEPGLASGLDGASLEEVLAIFAGERATTVTTVSRLSDLDWHRAGIHATYGRLDVAGLLRVALDHDAEHLL
jgi:DinB superfamily